MPQEQGERDHLTWTGRNADVPSVSGPLPESLSPASINELIAASTPQELIRITIEILSRIAQPHSVFLAFTGGGEFADADVQYQAQLDPRLTKDVCDLLKQAVGTQSAKADLRKSLSSVAGLPVELFIRPDERYGTIIFAIFRPAANA